MAWNNHKDDMYPDWPADPVERAKDEKIAVLEAQLTEQRDGHITIMEELLGRFNRLRGAALAVIEFKGEHGYIRDNDNSRDAIARLERALA